MVAENTGEATPSLFDTISTLSVDQIVSEVTVWFQTYVFVPGTPLQLGLVVLAVALAYLLALKPRHYLEGYTTQRWSKAVLDRYNEEAILSLIFPVITLGSLWLVIFMATMLGLPSNILVILAKLLTAWVVIRFMSSLVRNPAWSRIIATVAWTIAALSILHLLEPTSDLLDGIAFNAGDIRISLLTVIKGIISLILLLWLASVLSRILERRIHALPNLTPSVRVLITKVFKITLIALAILIGLESLGIDLTALTVLGGAIGLGLGFGLQKVVSNLFSGVILLLDRSVKPGDVIEVGDTYGWVNSLGARCISVLTRDGVEHLIPNELLITEKVINWSYSSPNVRLKVPIGIAYDADVRKAIDLVIEAANEHDRVLQNPEPACRFVGFGESALELEMRIWIRDPSEGIVNVRSDILLAIWDKFRENDVGIPFPQRDVHLKPSKDLEQLLENISPKKQ